MSGIRSNLKQVWLELNDFLIRLDWAYIFVGKNKLYYSVRQCSLPRSDWSYNGSCFVKSSGPTSS